MLKKFLSLLISLLMLFSVAVSASGSGSGAAGGASGGGIAGSGNSGTPTTPSTGATSSLTMLDPEVTIVNGTAYQVGVDTENLKENAVLRIALYNGNQLTGFINRTIYSDTVAGGTATFLINAGESDKAKVFLFDKTSPLSVLCSQEKDLTQALDLMLTMSGATVSGGTYKNVTVSSAVGDGEVFLNDVEIKGDLNIYGGGNNSIELFGCKVDGKILMAKEAGGTPPRLYLSNTPVSKIDVSRDALIEAADAASAIDEIDTVVDVHVQGASTVVNKINVLENSSRTVSVGGTATINEVVAKAPIMVMSNTIKKVEIPADATQKINVNVMVNANLEIEVNNSNGADITADIPGTNVTVSTELDSAPEVTIGGEKIEHIHKWNEGTVISEPTYAEEGSKVFACTDTTCGETKTEALPKLSGKDFYKFVENYNENPLRISWDASSLVTDGNYYLKFNSSTKTTIRTSKTVTGLAPALMEDVLPTSLSLAIYKGADYNALTPLYPSKDIGSITVTTEVPEFTIEKDASGNYNFISDLKGGMWVYKLSNDNGVYYTDNDLNGAINPYSPTKLSDGDIVRARYITWTLNEDKTFAEFSVSMIANYTYKEPSDKDEIEISLVQNENAIKVTWDAKNYSDFYFELVDKDNHSVSNGWSDSAGEISNIKAYLPKPDSGTASYSLVLYAADESFNVDWDNEYARLDDCFEITVTGNAVDYEMKFNHPTSNNHEAVLNQYLPSGAQYLTAIYRNNRIYQQGWGGGNSVTTCIQTANFQALNGDIFDIRILSSCEIENKTIKATITPPSKKTYSEGETEKKNIWLEMDGDDLNIVFEDSEGLSGNDLYAIYQNGEELSGETSNCIELSWYFENVTESTTLSYEIKKGTWSNMTPFAKLDNAVKITVNSTIPNITVAPQADGSYKLSSPSNTGFYYVVKEPGGDSINSGYSSDGVLLCGLYEGCTIDVRECSITVADDKLSADVIMSQSKTLSDITLATSSSKQVEVSNLIALQSAVNEGKVAVLTADITSEGKIYFKTGAPSTIKLNGHTITAPYLHVGAGKDLTIDGSVAGSKINNRLFANWYAKLTLNGGNYDYIQLFKVRDFDAVGITAQNSTQNYVLNANNCLDVTVKNSTFTNSNTNSYGHAINASETSKLTLDNVTASATSDYSSGAYIFKCDNVVITGGTYTSAQHKNIWIFGEGTFNFDPTPYMDDSSLTVTPNANGTYTISPKNN